MMVSVTLKPFSQLCYSAMLMYVIQPFGLNAYVIAFNIFWLEKHFFIQNMQFFLFRKKMFCTIANHFVQATCFA